MENVVNELNKKTGLDVKQPQIKNRWDKLGRVQHLEAIEADGNWRWMGQRKADNQARPGLMEES